MMPYVPRNFAIGCLRNHLLALLSDQELPEPLDPVSSPDGNLLLAVASNVGSNLLGRPFAASGDRLSSRSRHMKQLLSMYLTRRRAVVGLALTAAPVTLAGADHACAQA